MIPMLRSIVHPTQTIILLLILYLLSLGLNLFISKTLHATYYSWLNQKFDISLYCRLEHFQSGKDCDLKWLYKGLSCGSVTSHMHTPTSQIGTFINWPLWDLSLWTSFHIMPRYFNTIQILFKVAKCICTQTSK